MLPLYEQLQNPLTRDRDSQDRARIAAAFPVLQACSEPHFLALRRYLDSRPEKFFDRVAFEAYLNWLQARDRTNGDALRTYLEENGPEIDRALFFLREINSEGWHDRPLRTNGDYDLARSIDKYVHPTYLRLVEAVMAPLARPVAYFSRLERAKGTGGSRFGRWLRN